MIQIGGILRAQMARKNLKQKDLAQVLHVNQRTISSYCTNTSFPDIDTLSKLCNILDIDLLLLLNVEPKECEHLFIQSDEEIRLLDAFRNINKKQQKEFLESFIRLASLIRD